VDAGLDRCLSWLSTPSVLGCFLSSYRDSSPAYCLKPRVLGPSLAYCLELGASINEFHLLFIFIFFILKKWYENAFQQLRNLRILEKYKIAICANNRPVIKIRFFLSWKFLVFKKIILFHPRFMTTEFYLTIFETVWIKFN
jgi:hypothetical protein